MNLSWLLPDIKGIPVLMYHKVWPGGADALTISPERLQQQWLLLKAEGYRALSLSEFLAVARGEQPRPSKAVLITFDDGYQNNLQYVYPLLQQTGFKATFFIIGNTAITPDLSSGTILAGVTRDSVITLLKEMGLDVQERDLSIHEVIQAHKDGQLREVFGTGTAATISLIKELRYKEYEMHFDIDKWNVTPEIKDRLNKIRYGNEIGRASW